MRLDLFILLPVVACSIFWLSGPNMQPTNTSKVIDTASGSLDTARVADVRYRVDIGVFRAWEGYDSTLYWPGGASGPTIGSGLDLGNMGKSMIDSCFQESVSPQMLALLRSAHGVRGARAKEWVARNRSRVRVSGPVLEHAFLRTCEITYKHVVRKHPKLRKLDPTTQGIVLGLALNYGYGNPKLRGVYSALGSRRLEHELVLLRGRAPHALKARRQQEVDLLQLTAKQLSM